MRVAWLVPAKRLNDLKLARRIVQMVVTANNMRHTHIEIIDHHRKHIGRAAIASQQYHVVEILVRKGNITLDAIMYDGLAALRYFEPDHEWHVIGRIAGVAVPPTPVITHGFALGAKLGPHLV